MSKTFKIICNCGKELSCSLDISELADSFITSIGCSDCEYITEISVVEIKELITNG